MSWAGVWIVDTTEVIIPSGPSPLHFPLLPVMRLRQRFEIGMKIGDAADTMATLVYAPAANSCSWISSTQWSSVTSWSTVTVRIWPFLQVTIFFNRRLEAVWFICTRKTVTRSPHMQVYPMHNSKAESLTEGPHPRQP